MADELAHGYGQLAVEGVGFVAELESVTARFTGDPVPLEAIEGTVGALPPKSKGIEASGTVFVPNVGHGYSKITEHWEAFKRVSVVLRFGGMKVVCKGRFNAPEFSDDGSKCNFTFVGFKPRITYP